MTAGTFWELWGKPILMLIVLIVLISIIAMYLVPALKGALP